MSQKPSKYHSAVGDWKCVTCLKYIIHGTTITTCNKQSDFQRSPFPYHHPDTHSLRAAVSQATHNLQKIEGYSLQTVQVWLCQVNNVITFEQSDLSQGIYHADSGSATVGWQSSMNEQLGR